MKLAKNIEKSNQEKLKKNNEKIKKMKKEIDSMEADMAGSVEEESVPFSEIQDLRLKIDDLRY